MSSTGVRIEAEDQWGAIYAQDYLYRPEMTFAEQANYRVWAMGQFINGIASNGNYIQPDDGALVFTFRMPVFDSFTMTEILDDDPRYNVEAAHAQAIAENYARSLTVNSDVIAKDVNL